MDDIEKDLKRAQKRTSGLRELVDALDEDMPDDLGGYEDLDRIFDALAHLDAVSEHVVEIRSELRDALVNRVRRAVDR